MSLTLRRRTQGQEHYTIHYWNLLPCNLENWGVLWHVPWMSQGKNLCLWLRCFVVISEVWSTFRKDLGNCPLLTTTQNFFWLKGRGLKKQMQRWWGCRLIGCWWNNETWSSLIKDLKAFHTSKHCSRVYNNTRQRCYIIWKTITESSIFSMTAGMCTCMSNMVPDDVSINCWQTPETASVQWCHESERRDLFLCLMRR